MNKNKLDELNRSQLEQLIRDLAWNDEYGCYSRAGFQELIWPGIAAIARWIVFFDIDEMGNLNKVHSHAGVNMRIKKSLTMRTSDYLTGQRYSGDEFIIVVTDAPGRRASNPIELCARLAESLRENGLSATFAIAPVISDDLTQNVEPAVKEVEIAKSKNQRGSIRIVPGDPRQGIGKR